MLERAVKVNDYDQAVFYEIAVATDVRKAWRRYGWVPPSELPEYQAKWARAREPLPINGVRHD
jgi:hypothetical protein